MIIIDKGILKKYDALKEEQTDIRNRINRLEREITKLLNTQVSDSVMGTREDGTYGPIKIKGVPFPEYDKKNEQLKKRIYRYEEIDLELADMIDAIEDFIRTVADSRVRTILRLRYIDGKTWREVSKFYKKDSPSWAYMKVEKYFEKIVDREKKEH